MSATKLKHAKAIVTSSSKANLTIKQMLERLEPSCCNGSIIHVSKPDGSRYRAYSDATMAICEMFRGMDTTYLVGDIYLEPYSVAIAEYKGDLYYSFSDDMEFGLSCDFDGMFDLLPWFEPHWYLVEEGGVFAQRSYWDAKKK